MSPTVYLHAEECWLARQQEQTLNAKLAWWQNGNEHIDIIASVGGQLLDKDRHPTITLHIYASREQVRAAVDNLHRLCAQKVLGPQT